MRDRCLLLSVGIVLVLLGVGPAVAESGGKQVLLLWPFDPAEHAEYETFIKSTELQLKTAAIGDAPFKDAETDAFVWLIPPAPKKMSEELMLGQMSEEDVRKMPALIEPGKPYEQSQKEQLEKRLQDREASLRKIAELKPIFDAAKAWVARGGTAISFWPERNNPVTSAIAGGYWEYQCSGGNFGTKERDAFCQASGGGLGTELLKVAIDSKARYIPAKFYGTGENVSIVCTCILAKGAMLSEKRVGSGHVYYLGLGLGQEDRTAWIWFVSKVGRTEAAR